MKYDIQTQLNPLTQDLVNRFSIALAQKLQYAEQTYQYEAEWALPGWETHCRKELMRHIEKGDPIDAAAYCAFMWHHGWTTK